jgi:hypothetical protein
VSRVQAKGGHIGAAALTGGVALLAAILVGAAAGAEPQPEPEPQPPPDKAPAGVQQNNSEPKPAAPQQAQPRAQPSVRDQRQAYMEAQLQAMQRLQDQMGRGQVDPQVMVIDPVTGQFVQQLPSLPTARELEGVKIGPALLRLVGELDSPDFDRREQAMRDMVATESDLMELYAILARHELSLEQRYRLLAVVRDRLVFTPRGAVGISMRWIARGLGEPGMIEVTDLLEGLPGRKVLQLGDRISAIDGRVLLSQQEMLMMVQNKKPGDRVTLTILRPQFDDRGEQVFRDGVPDFRELTIELELGSADLLQRFGDSYSPVLQDRQNRARAAAMQYAPPVLSIPVPPLPGREAAPSAQGSEVDAHPMIVRLKDDLRRLDSGQEKVTQELLERWRADLRALALAPSAPGLDQQEVNFRSRLFQRYVELLGPLHQR